MPFQFPERNEQLSISLRADCHAFSRARESLVRAPWWKFQPYCCQGFGRSKPVVQRLLRYLFHRWSGLCPLQGAKLASNLQKERIRLRFRSDGYSIIFFWKRWSPEQKERTKDRSVWPGNFVRCVVLFSFLLFFRPRDCALFSKTKRKKFWRETPLVKTITVLLPGGWVG